MNAAAAVLLAAAAIIWLATPVFLVATSCREARARRAEKARREQESRETTPEWLAVLAATEPSPIYDRLVCEQMERAEGWVS